MTKEQAALALAEILKAYCPHAAWSVVVVHPLTGEIDIFGCIQPMSALPGLLHAAGDLAATPPQAIEKYN